MPLSRSSPDSRADSGPAGRFADLFSGLPGRWRLTRRISNGARFAGEAVFASSPDGSLEMTETGQLHLPGAVPVEAFRKWHWVMRDAELLDIRYPQEAGGGDYHRIQLKVHSARRHEWRGEASHLCGEDVYRGWYSLSPDCLLICHEVTGPAKDYRMASLYLR